MTQPPMVSIVCTNFNKGDWIREAVESFLRQELKFNYEIILIDDASTDKSPEIIKNYAEKYPEKIRAVFNEKNLGITRTWIKACKKAKGKYIARCDGDDYWIDTHKLQKQVDALKGSPGSLWCSTDFDVVLPDGTVTDAAAVENGVIKRATSYEDVLATRGFTMSSTWLVDTKLMLAVNQAIDKEAVDDTFNIQLELFHRTTLTYLPLATAAYRTGYGSDSQAYNDVQKVKQRNQRLLNTQLEYIDRYKDLNAAEALKIALRTNADFDSALADARSELIEAHKILKWQETTIEDANKHIGELDQRIAAILNSKRYKLGAKLLHPVASAKSVINRMKK